MGMPVTSWAEEAAGPATQGRESQEHTEPPSACKGLTSLFTSLQPAQCITASRPQTPPPTCKPIGPAESKAKCKQWHRVDEVHEQVDEALHSDHQEPELQSRQCSRLGLWPWPHQQRSTYPRPQWNPGLGP